MHIWFCKMTKLEMTTHAMLYISVIKAMRTLRIKWAKRKVMKISGQWWPRWIGFKLYVRYCKHATTVCCLSSLNWSGMRSRGLDIGQVLCCTSIDQDYSELKIRRQRDSTTADLVEGAWGEIAIAMARKIALRKLARRRVVVAPFPVEL